jgi:hypothetical protein
MNLKPNESLYTKSNDAHRRRITLRLQGTRARVLKVRTPKGCFWRLRVLPPKVATPAV